MSEASPLCGIDGKLCIAMHAPIWLYVDIYIYIYICVYFVAAVRSYTGEYTEDFMYSACMKIVVKDEENDCRFEDQRIWIPHTTCAVLSGRKRMLDFYSDFYSIHQRAQCSGI